ncbi:PRC-barrel domain-containing protein [Candidatus Nanopusillus massiliensis]|uniref:PRC-barrel domain-containing protein n=1 Tax=Candidatus Nanopusillus massiliensis TaxID=2897163 RepID=UPI001E516D9A|nr:PRC-barrel domain-containing protein [Candidatus Nanopusillus massiliensis]
MERYEASSLLNKSVVTDKGRKLGEIADLQFEEKTGEVIITIEANTTENAERLGLEETKDGFLVPFMAVKAIGDYVVVSEEDLVQFLFNLLY